MPDEKTGAVQRDSDPAPLCRNLARAQEGAEQPFSLED
jgi:hypothetical protein